MYYYFQRPEYLTAVPTSSMTERQEGEGDREREGDNRVEGADKELGGESIREEEGGVKGKEDSEDMEDDQIFYNNNIENGNKVGFYIY